MICLNCKNDVVTATFYCEACGTELKLCPLCSEVIPTSPKCQHYKPGDYISLIDAVRKGIVDLSDRKPDAKDVS